MRNTFEPAPLVVNKSVAMYTSNCVSSLNVLKADLKKCESYLRLNLKRDHFTKRQINSSIFYSLRLQIRNKTALTT